MKPIVIDLCCGKGGWTIGLQAAGWDVHGWDVDQAFEAVYPGTFHLSDVRTLSGRTLREMGARLIVASPPCQEFTRHQLPWLKRKNPPEPDLTIWQACVRIAEEAGLPLVLENVRNAQRWMGTAKMHRGAFYLWGDVPPLLPTNLTKRHKESMSSSWRAERAMVPFELAKWIGECFYPHPETRTA